MDFVQEPYQPGETIAAIATPPGEGGVAIIRISGNDAVPVANKIFSGPVDTYKSHTAHYGKVLSLEGEQIDNALLLVMLGKNSYTGENTVEIHCHGGSLITRRVLGAVLSAGARLARPGEFTFRSFINKKIDLAQAEAVQELISAKNERALDAAESQLAGKLSKLISKFQNNLTETAAILEAWVDFPEEGLEFTSLDEICEKLSHHKEEMNALLQTFHNGKILHEGLNLCLIGRPNVGKSSLMNSFLGKDRAIVSDIPGTTRDLLEDHMFLNGLNFKLTDTAGIRLSQDLIEQEGVKRSRKAMQQADLILLVLDASQGLHHEDTLLLNEIPQEKTLVIWNKIDLPHSALPIIDHPYQIHISATEKIGLEKLPGHIDQIIWKNGIPSKEEIVITNVRHQKALHQAISACCNVISGLQSGLSPEFITLDMRECLNELGKIIGTNISENILNSIFSKFCIGK